MAGRQIEVDADLTLRHGGQQIRVRGQGSTLTVEVPDVGSALRLTRRVGFTGAARAVSRFLSEKNLQVTLQTPQRRIATLGAGRGNWLLARLGLPCIVVHISG